MKHFWGYLRTDLRRLSGTWRWPAGIAGVAFFLYFALEGRGIINGNVVMTYTMAGSLSGSLLTYVCCAFPYATVFSEELERKYARYGIARGNLRSYVTAKALVIYLSALTTMAGGTLVFLLACRVNYPWLGGSEGTYQVLYYSMGASLFKAGHYFAYCMMGGVRMGLLAALLSMFAAFVSIYIRNRALVFSLPVLTLCVLSLIRIDGHSLYAYLPNAMSITGNDDVDFMLLFSTSAALSLLLGYGIYKSLEERL